MADAAGDVDQHVGDGRAAGAEVLEDLLELRHDAQHDEEQDADGEGDDEDRVDHRAANLALQRLGPLLELGQALENDFQCAARLAGLDHVHVQPIERLGRLAHGLGERGAAFDLLADVDERVLERAGLGLVFQNFQAAEDGQAGFLQDGQLAGEGGEHFGAHAAHGEGLAFLARPFSRPGPCGTS